MPSTENLIFWSPFSFNILPCFFTGLYPKKSYNLLTIFPSAGSLSWILGFWIWGNDCEYFHVFRIHFCWEWNPLFSWELYGFYHIIMAWQRIHTGLQIDCASLFPHDSLSNSVRQVMVLPGFKGKCSWKYLARQRWKLFSCDDMGPSCRRSVSCHEGLTPVGPEAS